MSDDRDVPDAGREEPIIRLQHFLPYRLSVASNAVSARIARAYQERFGLSVPEWRLVAILAELRRAVPQDLARSTRMDKIAVSRAAARLKERGLVAEDPNPRDRRSHFLSLTAAGWTLYREVAPLALAMEAELLAGLSEEEVAFLTAMLRRLESAALAG